MGILYLAGEFALQKVDQKQNGSWTALSYSNIFV